MIPIKHREEISRENQKLLDTFRGKKIKKVFTHPSLELIECHCEDGTHFRADGRDMEKETNAGLIISANYYIIAQFAE